MSAITGDGLLGFARRRRPSSDCCMFTSRRQRTCGGPGCAALSQPQRDMDDATVYRKTVVGHRNRVQSPHAYASRACGFGTSVPTSMVIDARRAGRHGCADPDRLGCLARLDRPQRCVRSRMVVVAANSRPCRYSGTLDRRLDRCLRIPVLGTRRHENCGTRHHDVCSVDQHHHVR